MQHKFNAANEVENLCDKHNGDSTKCSICKPFSSSVSL